MKSLFTIIAVLFFTASLAQDRYVIKGRVIDDSTDLAMEGASVICENTTKGTTTGSLGSFWLEVPAGGHNLVVSYTGYETQIVRVSMQQTAEEIVFRLRRQEKKMEEVVIQASNEVKDGWAKYGARFEDHFLGRSPFAALCSIENKEALRFYYSKKRNRLKVLSDAPLIVTNRALGYRIQYQLDSFFFEDNTLFSLYTGNAYFTELEGTAAEIAEWKKNREAAYFGSRLHFMRCYFDSTLNENGYIIEKMEDGIDGKPAFTVINDPYDTSFCVRIDSSLVEVNLFGKYRITYKEGSMDPTYLKANKYHPSSLYQLSTLELKNGFVITENGFFYEQTEVINSGYWAWKILADQLPYDYWPDEEMNTETEEQRP